MARDRGRSSDPDDYVDEFSDSALTAKLAALGPFAAVASSARRVYRAFKDPDMPGWTKAVCAGALGYFIFPIDVIPDVILGVGYIDDGAVLVAAAERIAFYVGKQQADEKRS